MLNRILTANKWWLTPFFAWMKIASVRCAARQQGLEHLSDRLSQIVPNLEDQYTTFKVDTEVLRITTRTLHAFQINLALRAIKYIANKESIFVVDIGDSSGTHQRYLSTILNNDKLFNSCDIRYLSVTLDPIAVEKIAFKSIDALLCRAEDIYDKYKIKADLLLSFEMLEHLYDPVTFLDTLSAKSVGEFFVLTVPYLSQSRVGLHHIRRQQHLEVCPENTHIFELSPPDWKLIFQHSGWKVVEEMIYRQYPRWSFWMIMKPIWKKFDFEGFYGVILKRDRTWAECYKDN